MKGRLIVIEGTDCSGKETQTKILVEKLKKDGRKAKCYSFPMYDTPTGRIVGGPYLGKEYICDGWFPEGATNVDYKVASLYYTADRAYNIDKIKNDLNAGKDVILDRYVYSNMAHQGAKVTKTEEKIKIFEWLEKLEFDLMHLPIPDIKIFLHMPTKYSVLLKEGRKEAADQHEASIEHLTNAEKTYLLLANYYSFQTIECINNLNTGTKKDIRTIVDISEELYDLVKVKKYHK